MLIPMKNLGGGGANMQQTKKFSSWRKLGVPVVLLAAVVAGACHYIGKDDDAGMRTVAVTRGDLEKSITAVGSIEPKDYVDVGTQVSGRVMKIHVEIGDRVAKGDLIAEIDPTVYESTVRKDRATLENLEAQLDQQLAESALAVTELKRNQEMRAADAISQATVDQADAQAKVAAATVAATRAQIKAAEATLAGDLANLGYTKIYAPLNGVDNHEKRLLPQMTVQVFFTLGEAKDVPLAPINALQAQRGAGANVYKAKVLTTDGVVERDVKVGLTSRSMAQIVSGLLPGDQLVVAAAVPSGGAPQGAGRQMGPRL
jgi:multidrug efflux pump subunit AcrA (membrane-fusion protein)